MNKNGSNTSIQYQGTNVEPNSGEIARHHAEKIKSVTQPVHITTHRLLAIAISNLRLKESDLIKAHIPPFTHLYVLMMSDIATTKSGIETYTNIRKILLNTHTLYISGSYNCINRKASDMSPCLQKYPRLS